MAGFCCSTHLLLFLFLELEATAQKLDGVAVGVLVRYGRQYLMIDAERVGYQVNDGVRDDLSERRRCSCLIHY